MSAPSADARRRYTTLIEATLRSALVARLERPLADELTMELALPAIARQLSLPGTTPNYETAAARVGQIRSDDAIADGAGHHRPAYWPLLMRAWAPMSPRPKSVDAFAVGAKLRLQAIANGRIPLSAAEGPRIVGRLLAAMALVPFDADAAALLRDAFAAVLRAQRSDGRFLSATATDQLEPAWYHELAVLHAVDLYARRSGDPEARAAVERSARYHAAEVQPDHASSHPFGLAALLDDAEGIYLADMMLHAAGVQQPSTMDAVSLVLLFDAIAPR